MFGRLRRRLEALLRTGRVEHELDEEPRCHLERLIEQNIASGMSPKEARFEARRSFGGIELAKDECRDARGVRFVEELRQDLRYGARMLMASPGFTAVAVLTLALDIGANSTVFSLINAALLRPLPYSDPQSLVMVWGNFRRLNMMRLGAFSLISLLLAGVGIFGVTAYTVARRTHEIGIRLALGAERRDILKLVVGQGMVLSLTGILIGILAALALRRFSSSLLYGVSSTDPLTFVSIALLLAVVAMLARYIPARRATRVDPMIALRYE